tara:strand:- start:384 stop:677 length:294 start_codon:yes stop_codon:yes gene_type:complete
MVEIQKNLLFEFNKEAIYNENNTIISQDNNKKSKKSRKTKCLHCNKKFLIVHLCKCNNHYCSVHRCPESHNCTFDFKNDSTNKIEFVDCNFKKIDKI